VHFKISFNNNFIIGQPVAELIKFSVASNLCPKKDKWMDANQEGIACPIPLQ